MSSGNRLQSPSTSPSRIAFHGSVSSTLLAVAIPPFTTPAMPAPEGVLAAPTAVRLALVAFGFTGVWMGGSVEKEACNTPDLAEHGMAIAAGLTVTRSATNGAVAKAQGGG